MTRPVRVPLVALLAALAALLAPLGAGPAVAAGHAARSTVAGSGHASATPAPRALAVRELREGAARRWQQDGTPAQLDGARPATGPSQAGGVVGVLVVAALVVAAAWRLRRTGADPALAGRTTGIRCGRGPPALACA